MCSSLHPSFSPDRPVPQLPTGGVLRVESGSLMDEDVWAVGVVVLRSIVATVARFGLQWEAPCGSTLNLRRTGNE